MNNDKFEKGYKALIRYLKEINKYPVFIKATAKYNPQYKTLLEKQFKEHERIGGWEMFFSYTWFVGEDYELYEDNGLNETRNGWRNFIKENCPDIL